MHPKAVTKIAEALRQIASTAMPLTEGGQLSLRIHDGVDYCLPPESTSLYSEQVRAILSHSDYSEKFSEAHLSKKLDSIFAALLTNEKLDVESEVQKLLDECDGFQNRSTVYLALEGVQTAICLRLGTIWIIPGGPELVSHLDDKAAPVVVTSKNAQATKDKMGTFFKDEFKREFTQYCAVVFSVNAEPGRALERAREEARFAVDLLRVVSKFALPLQEDVRVGLRGERPTVQRSGFVFSDAGFSTKHDSVGSVFRLQLDETTLRKMDELGLLALSDRYSKNQLTGLDKILVRSIHWLSVALAQDEPETALITLIVALECLI